MIFYNFLRKKLISNWVFKIFDFLTYLLTYVSKKFLLRSSPSSSKLRSFLVVVVVVVVVVRGSL